MDKKLFAVLTKLKGALSPGDFSDISEWRRWLSDTLFYFGIILIPFAMVFTLPTLLAEKQYEIIFIDLLACMAFFLRLIIKSRSYRLWGAICLITLYLMTLSFYFKLGPHFARSAWLVMNTVIAALFFGSRGALVCSLINPLILLALYLLTGSETVVWAQVHDQSFLKYISFVINTSLIAFVSSLLVGGLLDHLDLSYRKQKQMADHLNTSERKYRKLVSHMSDVIAVLDKDGIITYKSPGITKQFGWQPEELVGKSGAYTVHDEDKERVREKLVRLYQEYGATMSVEYRYLCKDGGFKPVELTAVNMLDDSTINGILANYRDISERQKATQDLLKSEEKFRMAFKTSPNPFTLTSLEDGTYSDINDGFTKHLGYTREDVIGKSSLELDIWKNPEDRACLVESLRKDGVVENLEATFKGKSGQITTGLMSARIIEINGKEYLLAITHDITELKKIEKERLNLEIRLQQAQKMEAIGTLAGGIAHDFNNILSGIMGYAQLALNGIDQPDKVENCISKIDVGAKRAAELVRQILTFSRQTEYKKHPLKIYMAVEEALELLRSSIPTSIEMIKKIDSKSVIWADPTKMHQLMINLCTNAYHAIGADSGTITVSLSDKQVDAEEHTGLESIPRGDYLKLEVIDTGKGMDESIVEKVFDPYFTTKEVGQGTGLGLALVKAIVKEHDGFITMTSAPDQGTCFTILFPVFKGKTDDMSPLPEKSKDWSGHEKIMVVDDEESILQSTMEFLNGLGYQVSGFSDGKKALSSFSQDPHGIDLVLTDMTMPGVTGDLLAKKMLRRRPDLPIILSSGYSEKISEDKALDIGIKKFIQKPIVGQDLAQVIRSVLDSE